MKTYSVGKVPGNTIFCTEPQISHSHADIIDNGDDTFTVLDHSTNGTYVNGMYLHNGSTTVKRGDSVVFAGIHPLNWGLIGPSGGGETVPSGKMAPFSVASMVLGILSLITFFGSVPMAIIGLCLGVAGTKRIKGQESKYRGVKMLKAGKICSIVALGIFGLVLLFCIAAGEDPREYFFHFYSRLWDWLEY